MPKNSKREESRTFLISVAAELAGMHAQTLRSLRPVLPVVDAAIRSTT